MRTGTLLFLVLVLGVASANALEAVGENDEDEVETEAEPRCSPYPACAIVTSPFEPPRTGGGGIIASERAPGFDVDEEWGELEWNEDVQRFIFHPPTGYDDAIAGPEQQM